MRTTLAQRLHPVVQTSMKRIIRDCGGTNILEAAIITPLLLLLTLALVDFASMFYVYLALENGASQATRYAVTGNTMANPSDPTVQLSRMESIKTAMRNATPTLTLPDSAFTFNHIPVGGSTWVAGVGGPNEIEKVTVDYSWSLLTPLLRPFFTSGAIHFTVDSAMKNEGRFQ
jgi:Flp pilus assembly protein TadG